jgi:hypothetical protein
VVPNSEHLQNPCFLDHPIDEDIPSKHQPAYTTVFCPKQLANSLESLKNHLASFIVLNDFPSICVGDATGNVAQFIQLIDERLVATDIENNSGRTTSLGENDRSPRLSNLSEHRGRVGSEVGDGLGQNLAGAPRRTGHGRTRAAEIPIA